MITAFRARRANRFVSGISGQALAAALAIGAFAVPACAQDAPADQADETEPAIVVTGFRAALETAVNTKKTSEQIVESVSSEDIGKLPDASIGESIARLPGLTSQRTSGRSNYISIRGFGPDFSSTLLNGRPQTSTNDNRGVEFDQYPSEVVSGVNIYKTPNAALVGQGLVGTIDIRTIRPLDYGKQVLAVGARAIYTDMGALNSGSTDKGYRLTGTFVTQFGVDDNMGLALSAAYVDEPYQIEEFEAWGYADGPNSTKIVGGVKPFVTSSQLKRFGVTGTFQARLSPEFTVTLDSFYSHFDDTQIKRGIELPMAWSGAALSPTGVETRDGVITGGTFTGVDSVINNHNFQRQADLYSGGLNLAYRGDSGWNATLDIGYSRTDRHELILESNSGTGPGALGAQDSVTFVTDENGTHFTNHALDYSNPATILLTDPNGWGGGAPGGHQEGYYNDRIVVDELKQYQGEIEREFEGSFLSAMKVGVTFTDRDKSLVPDEAFLQLANGSLSMQVPQQYLLRSTDLTYLGLGPMISYSPLALLDGGVYKLVVNNTQDVLFKSFDVSENVLSPYFMANISSDFGGATLTGNIGVLAQHTDQSSTGYIMTPTGPALRTFEAQYWDVLPSLNLSLRFDSDFVIRFGAAREIQRPRLDDMRINIAYGPNVQEGIVTGSGGNPYLRPYRANALDLTFEKYWGTKAYVAAQFFWKDLKNYIYTAEVPFDFTGFPVTQPVPPVSLQGRISQPFNGNGGSLYGVEAAGTLPLEEMWGALSGFGLTGGASYTKTSIEPTPGAPPEDIPGYSRWVANGTAYFEKWGFSARGSVRYRSSFVGDFSGFGANRVRRRAKAETIIDGQIGYEFQKGSLLDGLSVFLQGQNLTDEPFVSTNPGEPLQVLNHQRYGRRYLAGFNFKF
ncbi:MAG: TonB-dependent receptor [Pseudomonadota bacterium]